MRTRGTYAQPFRSFTEEPEGRAFVPTALHEDIQDVPVLINGTPRIMPLAVDLQKHLITMPLVSGLCAPTTELVGKVLSELLAPLPHRFIGYVHAACGQQFFDVTKTEVEAVVEPYRVRDNFLRKPKTSVGRSSEGGCQAASIA